MKKIFVCQTIKHIYTTIFAAEYFRRFEDVSLSAEQNIMVICSDHQMVNENTINTDFIKQLGFNVIILDEVELMREFSCGSIFLNKGLLSRNVSITSKKIEFASGWLSRKLNHLFGGPAKVYLFHDKTFLSKYFRKKTEVHLIEDGLANYTKNKVHGGFVKKVIRLFLGLEPNYYYLGESNSIENIYLFSRCEVPKAISSKVKFIEQDVFYSFDKFSKNDILKCFSGNVLQYDFEKYDFILLTQGLDVAKLCSQDDKVDIYLSMAEIIVRGGYRLLVKIHPSEPLNTYEKLSFLNNVDIMTEKIPLEALSHLVAEGTKIISLRSSAEMSKLLSVNNLVSNEAHWKKFDISTIKYVSQENLRQIL